MTDTPLTPADHDDALAAEYVLGVMSLSDRSAAQSRIKADAGFAARVAAWEERLSGLNGDYAEAPAPDLLPRIEARLFPQARRPRRLFNWFGGAVTAAALALAALVLLPLPRPAPPVVAVLGETDALRFEARFTPGTLIVTRVAGEAAPTGQVQELWIIAPDAAPVSLGLLEQASLTVPYPALPEGWTLAVTLEPAGGGPGGKPTGPVVAAAVLHGS